MAAPDGPETLQQDGKESRHDAGRRQDLRIRTVAKRKNPRFGGHQPNRNLWRREQDHELGEQSSVGDRAWRSGCGWGSV